MPPLILHVSVEHPQAIWGGIGTAINLLHRAAVRQSAPSALLTPLNPAKVPRAAQPTQDIRTLETVINGPGEFYSAANRVALGATISHEMKYIIRRLSMQNSIHVIVHNEEFLPLIRMLRGARNIEVLYFSHGLATEEHPGRSHLAQLQHAVHVEAPQLAVASVPQARAVFRASGREPTVIDLPLGLFVNLDNRDTPLPNEILAAGRFVRQKGFDILIQALGLIDVPPSCIIVGGHGDSSYEAQCREQAQAESLDIDWRPWQDADNLRALLRRTGCLIMPSRFEPLGLLAAEAIGLGTPVIGSDVGGLSTLLKDTSQVVVPCGMDGPHVQDLAQAIASRPLHEVSLKHRRSLEAYSSARTLAKLVSSLPAGG